MSDYTLRDLELAGIKWELADMPIMTQKTKTQVEAPQITPRQTSATIIA